MKMGLPASGYSIFCTLKWEFTRITIKNCEKWVTFLKLYKIFSSIGALEMQMSVGLSVCLHSLYLGQSQGRATLGLDRDLGFSHWWPGGSGCFLLIVDSKRGGKGVPTICRFSIFGVLFSFFILFLGFGTCSS